MNNVRSRPGVNPYSRLGLTPGASITDVKRAYRRLAMHLHPDRGSSGDLQTFLAVKAAYDWIVAQRTVLEPGDRRRGFGPRTTIVRPVRRVRATAARSAPAAAPRGSWPGGRWYWEGVRARAPRR
jgi:hypothetical protein